MDDINSIVALFELVTERYHNSKDVSGYVSVMEQALKTIDDYLTRHLHKPEIQMATDLQLIGYWFYRILEWHYSQQ